MMFLHIEYLETGSKAKTWQIWPNNETKMKRLID
jgi:hypothetical protein